jgi:hypothetical protein
MSTTATARIAAATAAEVCARFELPPEARAALLPDMQPLEFVAELVARKQYAAGVDFLAHALPSREGIWWAYLCMEHVYAGSLSALELAAVVAGVRWVIRPSEENRAAVQAPAQAAGLASPPGLLAMAVLQSGAPSSSAKCTSGAVKLAAAKADPTKLLDTQRLFVNLGIEVAQGTII